MSHPTKTKHVDPSGTILPEGHSIPSNQGKQPRPNPLLPDELLALESMFNAALIRPNPVLDELGIDPDGACFNPVEPSNFFQALWDMEELGGPGLTCKEEDTLFDRKPELKREAILLAARELLVFYRDEVAYPNFRYQSGILDLEINRALARTAMRLLLEWDRLNFEEVAA